MDGSRSPRARRGGHQRLFPRRAVAAAAAAMPRVNEHLPKELNFNGREVRRLHVRRPRVARHGGPQPRAQPARPGRAGPSVPRSRRGERRAAGAVADHRPVPAHGRSGPGGVACRTLARSRTCSSPSPAARWESPAALRRPAARCALPPSRPRCVRSSRCRRPIRRRITPRSVPPAHSPQYAAPGHAGAPRPDQAADAEAAEIRRRAQGRGSLSEPRPIPPSTAELVSSANS